MGKLRDRFKRGGIGAVFRHAFAGDDATWEAVHEALLLADVGAAAAAQLVELARERKGAPAEALRSVLLERLAEFESRGLELGQPPAVVLVVGVNGTGKTTSVGKIAHNLRAGGQDVIVAAADTFRAAAAEQLATWADRVGAKLVRGREGGDPAAVAFDAVSLAEQERADVVLIDTAGRLHTKQGLMDELSKLRRVVERKLPVSEVLLVIDATTGQNGLAQARVFAEAVDVTGIVLTKLDGSAKGGIVLAIEQQLGVPVKLVGVGEGKDDLIDFDPNDYVDALLS